MQTVPIKEGPSGASVSAMPFQVRGRFFTAIVLHLTGRADQAFHAALERFMHQSPQFFANAPIVLDLGQAVGLDAEADFLKLLWDLRRQKLFAIGVQNATERQSRAAVKAGLVTLKGGREADLQRPAANDPAPAKPAEPAEPARPSLLVTQPVRSGQRIFADRGDLVVVASVGSGAELIAHGNIHVYGPLRGRALAGVNGDTGARIFCQSLQAELIAIAGLYKTSDDFEGPVLKTRVQAYLSDDSLCIEPLG